MLQHSELFTICACSQDLNRTDYRESVDSSVMLIFDGYI